VRSFPVPMPTVAIIQRIIPHYRVAFFREVQSQAMGRDLDVTIYSTELPDPRLCGSFKCNVLPVRYLRGSCAGPCWINGLFGAVKGKDIIVAPLELNNLNIPYLWIRRKNLCRHWIWWGHAYNYQARLHSSVLVRLKEAVKRFMPPRSDGLIKYRMKGVTYWRRLGMPPEQVIPLINTIDVEGLRASAGGVSEEELLEIRHKLGLDGKRVLLFSGRLYREKKVDFLLRAYAMLKKSHPEVALLILGEGPERASLEMISKQLNLCHVHFLGEHVDPRQTGVYFRLSSLLVIPGLVGLAIVHGFAFGLPLVTTDYEGHSPEIEYLSAENGVITPQEEAAYAHEIEALLNNPARLAAMRQAALAKGDQLLLAHSVKRFVDGIRFLTGNPS